MTIFKAISTFFKAEKIEYWHRNRSIEVVALEKGLNVEDIKSEFQFIIKNEGRVNAIAKLRQRYHVPLSSAWRFIDKIE